MTTPFSSANCAPGGAVVVPIPAGAAAGWLLVVASGNDSATSYGAQTGFTTLDTQALTSDSDTYGLYSKTLTSGDISTGSVTIVTPEVAWYAWACAVAYPPGYTVTLVGNTKLDVQTSTPVTITAPGGTTTRANTYRLWIAGSDPGTNSTTETFSAPASPAFTLLGQQFNGRNSYGAIGEFLQVSAGSFGSVSGSVALSAGQAGVIGWTLIVEPPATATDNPGKSPSRQLLEGYLPHLRM